MKFKEGIITTGVRAEVVLALMVIDKVYENHGLDLVVTSVCDGKHSVTSLHYSGQAADLRIWNMEDPATVVEEIKDALGRNPDYDVVLESDHIHFEWQPKRK